MKIYNESPETTENNNCSSSTTTKDENNNNATARDQHSQLLIRSQIKFDEPPANSNMARELWEAFGAHSDRVLLVDAEQRREWSGGQLRDVVGRIATGLAGIDLKPNDIVMTICEHTGVEILAALGSVVAGAGLYGTSPQDGYNEVRVLCELAKPNVIIVNSRLHERALALRQNVQGLAGVRIIWIDNPLKSRNPNAANSDQNNNNNCEDPLESIMERDQVVLLEDLMSGPLDERLIDSIVHERIRPKEHLLTYMLTSGSTGRPKVVPSTHEELVYGMYSMISATRHSVGSAHRKDDVDENNNNSDCNGNHGDQQHTKPSGRLLPVGPDKVCSGDLPLDHGAGLNTMFLALILGAKYVVMPAYDVDSFWQAVQDYRITTSVSSTTFGYKLFARLKELIDSGEPHKWDISSLEFISFAGAKLACLELVSEVTRVHTGLRVSQSYGCTEIGFISMVHGDERSHLNSTGYLFPGLLAKIVDPERPDCLLGPEQLGELCVWARSKFKGYRCHPDDDGGQIFASCHDERGEFYRTGDQAHMDSAGRIHIHGRFKDTLVLMEDWKILPVELEQLINEHPLVEMSAVVGKPNPELPGCHKPKAFVKLIGDQHQLAGDAHELVERFRAKDLDYIRVDIVKFVAERTAKPKHLTGGVQFVDEFPRVGLLNKVDRKALNRMD